jgi:thioredoxin 1
MAKNKDSKKGTIGLIAAAFLLLAAIVVYAWGKTPETKNAQDTNNNNQNQQTESEQSLTEAEKETTKLGPNEINLTNENFDSEIVKSDKVALVDVYLPTCPHCQKVAPIVTEISNEYAGRVKVGKMNASVPQNRDFVINLDSSFQYVPSFWIYKDGKKVDSFTGEQTKEELKAKLDKYLQ